MDELLKPLKMGDEVYIPGLEMYGKVLKAHPGSANEPVEDGFYIIQIKRYCRRADLVLYEREAEREKRDASRREKMARVTVANKEVENFVAAGGDINSPEGVSLCLEWLKCSDAMRVELGHAPMFLPVDDGSAGG
jgi:hypothetical protein